MTLGDPVTGLIKDVFKAKLGHLRFNALANSRYYFLHFGDYIRLDLLIDKVSHNSMTSRLLLILRFRDCRLKSGSLLLE
jgi:hypothetical protein